MGGAIVRCARHTRRRCSCVEPSLESGYACPVETKQESARRLWWVPVALGVAILSYDVLGFFDPSGATPSPYNELELFAEVPGPATAQQIVQIALGLLGISTLVVIEFAYSRGSRLRSTRTPLRSIVFVWAAVGFALESINGIRLYHLLPEMAHYYHTQGGALRDIAAIFVKTIELDPFRAILATGTAAWVLYLSIDLLSTNGRERLWGAFGLVLVGSVVALLVSMLINLGGLLNTVLETIVRTGTWPLWLIGIGVHILKKRLTRHGMSDGGDSKCT